MTLFWISLAMGAILLAIIALLLWRERGLRRQLAQYRDLLTRAADSQNIQQTATSSVSSV